MRLYRIWWTPQVSMEAFYMMVSNPEEGSLLLEGLSRYDQFQRENNLIPDRSNTGGLEFWNKENKEWEEWLDEEDYDIWDTKSLDYMKEEKTY